MNFVPINTLVETIFLARRVSILKRDNAQNLSTELVIKTCMKLVKEGKYYRYPFISPSVSLNVAYCGAWVGVISGFCVEIWGVRSGKKEIHFNWNPKQDEWRISHRCCWVSVSLSTMHIEWKQVLPEFSIKRNYDYSQEKWLLLKVIIIIFCTELKKALLLLAICWTLR